MVMDSFATAQENLEWTTSPKLFEKFPKNISDYSKDIWTEIIDEVTKTVSNFNVDQDDFKDTVLYVHQYEEHMNYLKGLSKPPTMDPRKFLPKLSTKNCLAQQLPNAPATDV